MGFAEGPTEEAPSVPVRLVLILLRCQPGTVCLCPVPVSSLGSKWSHGCKWACVGASPGELPPWCADSRHLLSPPAQNRMSHCDRLILWLRSCPGHQLSLHCMGGGGWGQGHLTHSAHSLLCPAEVPCPVAQSLCRKGDKTGRCWGPSWLLGPWGQGTKLRDCSFLSSL